MLKKIFFVAALALASFVEFNGSKMSASAPSVTNAASASSCDWYPGICEVNPACC